MNDHIALLVKATDGMTEAEQVTFHQAFEGAIIFFISRDRWVQAIHIASEVVKTTNRPAPVVRYDFDNSPEFLEILRKNTPYKEVVRGNARRRKQLRDVVKHGGSIGGIRIEKKGRK